jgi:hypothetical protein
MKYFKRAAEKGDPEGIDCYIRSICMKHCGDDSFEKEVSDLKKMINSRNDYFIPKYLKKYNHGFFGTVNPSNAVILSKSMAEQSYYLGAYYYLKYNHKSKFEQSQKDQLMNDFQKLIEQGKKLIQI